MPLPLPLVWIFFAHVLAMFPDFLFTAGIAHERWMGVFLGHITTHFVRGPNLTWFAVFLAALAAYLAVLLAYLEPSSHERTGAVRAHLGPGPAARSAASTCWRASPWTAIRWPAGCASPCAGCAR